MGKENLSQLLYRTSEAADQVINDTDKYHHLDARKLWEKISSRRSTKYEIFIGVLRLIKNVLPKQVIDILKEKTKKPYYTNELPFDPEKYKFEGKIGSGGQSRVYLLKGQQEGIKSLAMKVFLPRKNTEPEDMIKQEQEACREFGEIYKNLPELIPETKYIILRDPYEENRSAAVALKPFYDKIEDLFDYSLDELYQIAESNPELKDQLIEFSHQTLNCFNNSDSVPDLIGAYNISIVDDKKLNALDPTFTSAHNRLNGKRLKERSLFLKNFLSRYEE